MIWKILWSLVFIEPFTKKTDTSIRCLSTSNNLLSPQIDNVSSNLIKEQKVIDTIKEYDKTHTKPEFQHPGYPNF